MALTAASAAALSACAGAGAVDAGKQEAVARDPAAMMRIAEAAETSGDLPSAQAFYDRAAGLRPGLAAAQIGHARTLARQGDVGQALDILRSAHTRDPNDPEITRTLGRLLVVAKQPDEAMRVFQGGLAIDPRSTAFLVGKGVALDKLGRHLEAQGAYQAALAISPDDAIARKNLALSKALVHPASGLHH